MSQMRKGTPWADDVRAEKSRVVVVKIVFLICRLLFVGERYAANAIRLPRRFPLDCAISRSAQGTACTGILAASVAVLLIITIKDRR